MEATDLYDEDLPEGLREIKNLIGTPAAMDLVAHFGGRHVWVPRRYDDDSQLGRIIGKANLVQLVNAYAGLNIYIAKADRAIRAVRNIEISRRFEGGITASRLAGEYGLTERQVWNILAKPETLREDRPDQGWLFD